MLARRHGAGRAALLDSAVLTAAGAVVLWVVVLAASPHVAGLSLSGRFVTMAYPVMDLLVLAIAAPLALSAGRSPRVVLVTGWVVLQLTGDVIFKLEVLDDSFRRSGAVFPCWLASFAVLSAAGRTLTGVT